MARLAIRATGDRSKRETITTGNDCVYVDVIVGNKTVRHLKINEIGDVLQRSIEGGVTYWPTYTRNGYEKHNCAHNYCGDDGTCNACGERA